MKEEAISVVYNNMANWDILSSRGKVQDRRAFGPTAKIGGGLSLTGLAVVLLLNYLGGGDLSDVLTQLNTTQVHPVQDYESTDFEGTDEYEVFTSTVLGSNNDMWSDIFAQSNRTYEPPLLVLFRGSTESACGGAHALSGPHYCPLDETIYLDETFFEELTQKPGAQGGDVAQAYVISHEVAHHAQNELGIMGRAGRSNEMSIKLELQADCFAGLWAHSIKDLGVFGQGEIHEAIDAARSVGDDHIQETTTGSINPEQWTHGSSEDRVTWFNKGYNSGSVVQCDTFN